VCGRYTLATPADDLVEAFDLPGLTFDYFARFNIAPGQNAPVVAEDGRGRRMGLLRWGLVPAWKDEPGAGFINARAETVQTKASFREAFARRRCLVPADGFYEWRKEDAATGGKRPFWIHPVDGSVLSFAGIWESWSRPGADPRHAFAILTTEASADVSHVHDRMPVLVGREDRARWLDRTTELPSLLPILGSAPVGTLVCRPVDVRVNRVGEDDPGLIEPVL
jgi:putative SOS response-associated peptidase YedK